MGYRESVLVDFMEINNCNWYFHGGTFKVCIETDTIPQCFSNIISSAFSALRSGMVDLFINRTLLPLRVTIDNHLPPSHPCAKDRVRQRLCGFL